jgi:hypothetical protein
MARKRADFGVNYGGAYYAGGGATPPAVEQDKSLVFDDTYGMVSAVSGNVGISDTFTFGIWVKNTAGAPAGADNIMSVRSGAAASSIDLQYATGSNTDIEFSLVSSVTSTRQKHKWDGASVLNEWRHFVVMWNGEIGGVQMYIDGVATDPTTTTTNLDNTSVIDASRGVRTGLTSVASTKLIGIVYSAAVWDSNLTQDEVTTLYNSGDATSVDLENNNGDYESAANLIHYFRYGIGDDEAAIGLDHKQGTSNLSQGNVFGDDPTSSDQTADVPSGA